MLKNVSEIEDRAVDTTQNGRQREKKRKNEESITYLWTEWKWKYSEIIGGTNEVLEKICNTGCLLLEKKFSNHLP